MIQQRLRTRGSEWSVYQGGIIIGGRPDADSIRAASPNRCGSLHAHTTAAARIDLPYYWSNKWYRLYSGWVLIWKHHVRV